MINPIRTTAVLLLFGLSAQAATILFSNLVQPGNQYGPDAIGIGNTPGGGNIIAATRFSVGSDSRLGGFQVPVDVRTGPNELSAYLLTEVDGQPGSVIEAYALADMPSGFPPLTTVASNSRPLLEGNRPYWFAVSGSSETFGGWTLTLFQGSSLSSTNFATTLGGLQSNWTIGTGGSGAREGALVVIGTAVPEPGSSLLIVTGLLLVIAIRKLQIA